MDKRFLIIFAVSILLFTANIWGISIYILDEAKNSVAAREMLEGDHIVPSFNYELRTDKPPLHYYFMMLSYSLFGVTEFGARFFSAFFGIALVSIVYLFTERNLTRKAAFWSALTLLSSIQLIIQFHMAVPDPYLIFFYALSMLCAYSYYVERKNYWINLSYISLSLAVLSKGPVALLLAGGSWIFFLILRKEFSFKSVMSFRPIIGLVIILFIAAPWYVLVHFKTEGAWTTGFFLKHNVGRFVSAMEGHGGSFLLIPLYLILGLFPYSLFIFPAIRQFWNKRENGFLTLAATTSVVIVVFFSLSNTKLPSYPAPAFPFVAILVGYYISKKINSGSKVILWIYRFYFLLAIAFPIAIYIVLEDVMNLRDIKNLAFCFILLPIGALIAISFFLRRQPLYAFLSIGTSWIITTLFFFYLVFPEIDKRNAVYKSVELVNHSDSIFYFQRFNPSYAFYAKRKIAPLTDRKIISDSESIVILSQHKNLDSLDSLASNYQIIQTNAEFFEPYFSSILFEKKK